MGCCIFPVFLIPMHPWMMEGSRISSRWLGDTFDVMFEDLSYRRLARDPTDWTERKTTLLLKKSTLTEDICKQLRPAGSRPPRLYELLKIHKEGVPPRSIVSNTGAPTYQLSKYLAGILIQLTGNSAHHVKNSFQFVQILKSLRVQPEDLMVSFDVVSLFHNVPIVDSLDLRSQHFEDNVLVLFKHVLTSTYFCFVGQFHEQTDVIAMGSPLSPVIANFFHGEFWEERDRTRDTQTCMLVQICRWYFRHLAPWSRKTDRVSEPPQWTPQQDKICNGKEEEGHLPFLDIDICRKADGSLGHKVYRKPTHTSLYLRQNSHHHPANKQSVLASLIHRAKSHCDQDTLTQELEFLTAVFKDNG